MGSKEQKTKSLSLDRLAFLYAPDGSNMKLNDYTKPSGDTIDWSNSFLWMGNQQGLTAECKISPASLDEEIYWFLDPADFPAGSETKVRWLPWDEKNNRPHVGVGTSPTLKVTYENPQSKYTDFMPPDNRWFGPKKITVHVGAVTVTRPVWFFFNPMEDRTIRSSGKKERSWFHYWKESGAVPALANFDYDASLGDGTAAIHSWSLLMGDKYYVGFAADSLVRKSVFDVNISNSYTEESYPNDEGKGIHAVAKYCIHELWHGICRRETRYTWNGGLGYPDPDWDGLSSDREAALGTNPNMKDTCGLSLFTDSGHGSYSGYASYADQELFCRWKQDDILGDISKDWSAGGTQSPKANAGN